MDHLGDVIWSIPFVEQLASQASNAQIHYCCLPACREVPQRMPAISRVWVYDPGAGETVRRDFRKALKAEKFDLAVVLGPVDKMNLLAFASGAPRRVGYFYRGNPLHYLENLLYLTHKYPHPADLAEKAAKPVPHEVEAMLELLPCLGFEISPAKKINVPLNPQELEFARNWRESRGIFPEQKIFGIHLSQKAMPWGWGPEEFAGLVARLQQRFHGFQWVLTYGPQEKAILQEFSSRLSHIQFAGDLSLGQLGALIAGFSIYLTWDTGVVHLAQGLGTPVVDVFPPDNFDYCLRRWGPWGGKALAVKQDGRKLDEETCEAVLEACGKLLHA